MELNRQPANFLHINDIAFSYKGGEFALSVSLSVQTPVKLAVLGPNGSGKTTLLRLLGGHLKPTSGEINWAGMDLTRLPPKMRPTSTVFQNYALFPHFTVRENIEFPLRHRKELTRQEIRTIADEWLCKLQLNDSGQKRPSELSPGVQQRVAIARSLAITPLAITPKVLLLDEPSAALDVSQKHELITLLNRLFEQHSVEAMIIVTHDLDLAFSVATKVAVMDHGRLEALDDPLAMVRQPCSAWLARYLRSQNVVCGVLQAGMSFIFAGGVLRLPSSHEYLASSRNKKVVLVIPTNAVFLVEQADPDTDVLSARVDGYVFQGPYCEISLSIGPISVRSFTRDLERLPCVGTQVFLAFDLTKVRLLPNT